MAGTMRVLQGGLEPKSGRSALEAAFDHFRLERQGNLVSPATLENYDFMVRPFLSWLAVQHPEVRGFPELTVPVVRAYRAELATRCRKDGQPLEPATIFDAHRAIGTFFRWARAEGYEVDPRLLELARPKVPKKEPTLFHISRLREVLEACNPDVPQEALAVRILIGSGVRASELCGLAVSAPDGLSDLILDSMDRGRVELRVRWDAGAKGRKSRRVPVTPKLAAAIKRYEARQRLDGKTGALLVNQLGRPYKRYGIDAIMDRLERRVGFRVHAHAFRHTFATVATQLGWNFERLRAAMGHEEYSTLQRYVRLATEIDLGPRADWTDLIAANPALEWL